jgi:outer membrane usher protein
LAISLAVLTGGHAATPPDVAALTAAAEQDIAVVTVSVNRIRKEGLAYILGYGDGLRIDVDTLRRLSIRFDSAAVREHEGRLLVPLETIAGLSWSLDEKQQHLDLASDPRTIAMTDISYQFTSIPPPQLPHWGGFLNYGLFGTSALSGGDSIGFGDSLGAGLTASVFGPYGIGTAGVLVNPSTAVDDADKVVVLDANWRWDNIPDRTTLLVGDTVAMPGWWGRAVRFGGIQFGSNFTLQPGFVTYPLLAVSGLAVVPSTADVLVNNVRVAEQGVPAGPFTISNLPTMTGAGELNLVVRDAFGQERLITQPFYIAQQLLRPGLTEYSLGAGAERLNYGLRSFDYGDPYATGWVRHGLHPNVTAEFRAEVDSRLAGAGVGADILVGDLGVVSAGAATSQGDRGTGGKYFAGFDRQTPFISFGARWYQATPEYEEIGETGPRLARWSNAFARAAFGPSGSIAFAFTAQRYRDADPLTIYTASYSVNVGRRAFLTLAASRFTGSRDQTQVLALLTVPLDTLTSASVSVQSNRRESETSHVGEAYVQRSLPVGEGYGYYLRANTERTVAGGVTYAGAYGRYTLEAATETGNAGLRASVTGGVAWVGDAVLFAQPIEQSFALVRVGELDGVRVLQENQDVGQTRQGRLMLAQLPSLNPVTIAIDPLSVPIDMSLDATTKRFVTLPRTGVVVDFTATRERSALVRLALPSGAPVPIGASVQIEAKPGQFPVGHDGEVFLTRLEDRQTLLIRINGRLCRAALVLDPAGPAIADIGPLRCEYLTGPASSGGTQ